MTPPETVDEYIAAQAADAQPRLRELREIFRSTLPDAAESISYGLPTYKPGAVRVYFGAAKRHCAIYAASAPDMAEELAPYLQPKGTLRFPLNQPIPDDLVRRVLQATLAQRGDARK